MAKNKGHIIKFNKFKFGIKEGETILQCLERHKLDGFASSNCRQGHCGVCNLKLVSGEIYYENEPIALFDGEVVICNAFCTTDIELARA